jgi:hypothetical protein
VLTVHRLLPAESHWCHVRHSCSPSKADPTALDCVRVQLLLDFVKLLPKLLVAVHLINSLVITLAPYTLELIQLLLKILHIMRQSISLPALISPCTL